MAHNVKCPICGKTFDRDKEPFIKINARRYAHPACVDSKTQILSKEDQDKEKLYTYINQLFHTEFVNPRIQKQIKNYVENYHYTYNGILKSLVYFYDVEKHTTEKANDGIAIVPWIYKKAYDYYYAIWLAQQKNENKILINYIPEDREIIIPRPKAIPRRRHLFSFLDESEE